MKDHCIILMFDKKFLVKANLMIKQIREIGLYKGDIVCIISDDLKNSKGLPKGDNIIIKHFKEVDKSKILNDSRKQPTEQKQKDLVQECFPMSFKSIHYHKFYCFHTYFKENYKRCFYIDTGTHIFKPLDKILNLDCKDKFLAHCDGYPEYKSKLAGQFDKVIYPELFNFVNLMYNLNVDSFQATVFLYDTSIIQDDTFKTLVELANIFINSKTNDQAILNLYFNCLLKKWEQLKLKDDETYYYDFYEREGLTSEDYIMLKYPKI